MARREWLIRLHATRGLLFNEFLKAHRRVRALDSGVAQLTARLKEQDPRIQKVSEQLEISNAALPAVNNQ